MIGKQWHENESHIKPDRCEISMCPEKPEFSFVCDAMSKKFILLEWLIVYCIQDKA